MEEINELDKNGDNFRYPTSYSLEYRFDNKELDISNVYTYLKAIINFLDGCDSMLDAIADYQSEIKAEYEAEMRASLIGIKIIREIYKAYYRKPKEVFYGNSARCIFHS